MRVLADYFCNNRVLLLRVVEKNRGKVRVFVIFCFFTQVFFLFLQVFVE